MQNGTFWCQWKGLLLDSAKRIATEQGYPTFIINQHFSWASAWIYPSKWNWSKVAAGGPSLEKSNVLTAKPLRPLEAWLCTLCTAPLEGLLALGCLGRTFSLSKLRCWGSHRSKFIATTIQSRMTRTPRKTFELNRFPDNRSWKQVGSRCFEVSYARWSNNWWPPERWRPATWPDIHWRWRPSTDETAHVLMKLDVAVGQNGPLKSFGGFPFFGTLGPGFWPTAVVFGFSFRLPSSRMQKSVCRATTVNM